MGPAATRRYWLMKSESSVFSIEDLRKCRTTCWDGVRNFEARNSLRDMIRVGDGVLFYHSSAGSAGMAGIAGMAEVVRGGYPDSTAWDPHDHHYDPKSTPERPIWYMVDVRFVKAGREIITPKRLRAIPALRQMILFRKSRLSVQPVTPKEWKVITRLPEWAEQAERT